MNPCALYLPTGGRSADAAMQGYVNALTYMGWDIVSYPAGTKYEIAKLIEEQGVTLIFTTCRYGIRQLPVDVINRNRVSVVVQALLFNAKNETLGATSECVDPSDPYIVQEIGSHLVHTAFEPEIRDRFMHRWFEIDQPLFPLRHAADITRSFPTSLIQQFDIAFAMSLAHRVDVMDAWIAPMLSRLGRTAKLAICGDDAWQRFGLRPGAIRIGDVAELYSRAGVCPNLHCASQRGATLNDRSFSIGLCGGYQVSDNHLATEVFGGLVPVARTPSDYVMLIEDAVKHPKGRMKNLLELSHLVATRHTYFQRLADIFECLRHDHWAVESRRAGERFALRHDTEMRARIAEL